MLRLTAVEFVAPPRIPLDSVRARERAGYFHFLLPEAVPGLPFKRLGIREDNLSSYRPPRGTAVAVAPAGTTSADLAIAAARKLFARLSDDQRRSIGAIIFCHNAMDERLNASTVGRLQLELDLPHVLPFAVSQCSNCAFFVALEIADAFTTGTAMCSTVLIVAADKWLFPFLRSFGEIVSVGDGAGAALVENGPGPGWLVERAAVVSPETGRSLLDADRPLAPAEFTEQSRRMLAELICALGADRKFGYVVPQNFSEKLIRELSEHEFLKDAPIYLDGVSSHGHLSSADTIANLAGALPGDDHPRDAPVLAWGLGLNGEMGGCILRRQPD